MDIDTILKAYSGQLPRYQSVATRVENLLCDLLKGKRVKIHFAESRAKKPESLREKLVRPGKSYSDPLSQVPDLIGVRLILYYQNDLEVVGTCIQQEFDVIEHEQSHKPGAFLPDRFGYVSDHYVVKVAEPRASLQEWHEAKGIQIEIQVRTVLQHAWAAVSHALQYKREGNVPFSLKRRLFRLAGMFELADEQFAIIRNEQQSIREFSEKAVHGKQLHTRLDAPVIKSYIHSSNRIKELVNQARKAGDYFFPGDEEYDAYPEIYGEYQTDDIGMLAEEFERLGVATIEDLDSMLSSDFTAYLKDTQGGGIWHLTPDFLLLMVLFASYPDRFTQDRLVGMEWHPDMAARVLEAATSFHQQTEDL